MKRFQRKIEDFTCEYCGQKIKGNGYTNHCPVCLYSKHVDINPGDRAAKCQGLMQPIAVEIKQGKYILLHQCIRCGQQKRNKTVKADSMDAIIEISKGSG